MSDGKKNKRGGGFEKGDFSPEKAAAGRHNPEHIFGEADSTYHNCPKGEDCE